MESLKVLEGRGLLVEDREFAERNLTRIGYYRLSAYWYPFRKFENQTADSKRLDEFRDGARFHDVMDFYLFDKKLRLHLSDGLERIEIAVRAQLVDVLGQIGPFSYRDPRSYTASFTNEVGGRSPLLGPYIAGLDLAFERSKEEFAKHFRSKYEGPPPVWIAAGTWDWGNLSYMLGYLSERNRDLICQRIDPRMTRKSLASWMKCLNDVRNACAHHSRLWNKPLINSPRLQPSEISEFSCLLGDRGRVPDSNSKRLYGALVVMAFLMCKFYPKTEWHVRLCNLISDSDCPEEVNSLTAGFPTDWNKADIWQAPQIVS